MKFSLAQINIGRLIAPIDDPLVAEFKNNLDHINEIAEASQGFIWRLKDEENNATSFNPYDDDRIIINMSIWEDLDSLKKFVYHSEHLEFFKKRKQWFEAMSEEHMALWFCKEGEFPSAEEGKDRLDHLRKNGPTKFVFDYRSYHLYNP